MKVPVGLWRAFPKEQRLLMLMSVVAYQANKRRLKNEKATCCNR
jgi:hypothetical protein